MPGGEASKNSGDAKELLIDKIWLGNQRPKRKKTGTPARKKATKKAAKKAPARKKAAKKLPVRKKAAKKAPARKKATKKAPARKKAAKKAPARKKAAKKAPARKKAAKKAPARKKVTRPPSKRVRRVLTEKQKVLLELATKRDYDEAPVFNIRIDSNGRIRGESTYGAKLFAWGIENTETDKVRMFWSPLGFTPPKVGIEEEADYESLADENLVLIEDILDQ